MSEPKCHSPRLAGVLWSRFTWRHWCRSPRSSLLLAAILALGVAALFSVRLANRAAVSGFQMFSENLTGGSDLVVRSPSGRLPESDLRLLRDQLGALPVGLFPVLETTAALITAGAPATGDELADANAGAPLLQLTGVDFVALRNAYYLESESGHPAVTAPAENTPGQSLGESRLAFIAPALAKRLSSEVGNSLQVAINDQIVAITVGGILTADPSRPQPPENLLLFDLPGLQRLLQRDDQLSRIEIRVAAGRDRDGILDETTRQVRDLAVDRQWLIETPDDRAASSQAMTAAFRLNLTVLSTLALLVGWYLILQALEAAVVRRRQEIAILRSLGVHSAQIRRAWMVEALALGMIGTAVGLVIGWGAAQFTVGNIAKTVSALYYQTTTTAAAWHWGEMLFAASFGIGASLFAGWLPARDAGSTPPVQGLREERQGDAPRSILQRPVTGAGLIFAGILLIQAPPWINAAGNKIPVGGYLAALCWLVGLSLLAGTLFHPLAAGLTKFRNRPAMVYAGSQLRNPSGRHRLTAAGLVVAIGMAAGMGILVHSFEKTLTGWIGDLLKADLYVAPAGIGSAASQAVLSEATWQTLSRDPAVAGVDRIRRYPIFFQGRATLLAGSEYARHERSLRMNWREAPLERDPLALETRADDGAVPAWISESFSIRFDKHRGDRIEVPTPAGPQAVLIDGVYVDYHNESGTLLLNRKFTSEWFDDDQAVNNIAVFLKPDADADAVRARWSSAHPALVIRTNRRLREEALRVFHQTFAVTHALEAIGIAVAVSGLGLTLASLMVERRRQITTLKQLGMARAQIARATAIESLGLAGVGTVAGLILSVGLGYILIFVVNRQSFGWTLQFHVPLASMAGLATLTLLTSIVVGYLVGRSGAHLKAEQQE